ncbi:MAG: T9SS type A sorting domain-containing protein [Ignavibacteria bacterium]|nr:T9SS type A sorting domain-containing protein [Ignavibacteria bacterium]
MKTLILIMIFYLSILNQANSQFIPPGWYIQQSNVSSTLLSVDFVDNYTGWVVGVNGLILKTTNGGENWFQQVSGTTRSLRECSFVSSDIGYAFDSLSMIIKTTNSGVNWFQQFSGTSNKLTSSSIVNDSVGYLCGLNRTLLKTTNGGNNWVNMNFPDSLNLHSIYFINNTTGWLSAEKPNVAFLDTALFLFKTTNGGINWELQFKTFRQYSPLTPIFFIDSLHGWMVVHLKVIDYSNIFRTTDGGKNWSEYIFGNAGSWSIFFINERKGWAAGTSNRIQYTTDGGVSWVRPNTLPSRHYTSIVFSDSITGWAVSEFGVILKTTNGGVLTDFTNISSEIPDKFSLSQNYPNPFNPNTIINYQLSMFNFVSLKVYDVLGNEVAVLVNEKQNAGAYSVEFDGSGFSSGVYLYRLEVNGNHIDTKRMILLK